MVNGAIAAMGTPAEVRRAVGAETLDEVFLKLTRPGTAPREGLPRLRAEGDPAPPARPADAGDPDPVPGGAGADLRLRGAHRRARHRHRDRGPDARRRHPRAAGADRRLGPVPHRPGVASSAQRTRGCSSAAAPIRQALVLPDRRRAPAGPGRLAAAPAPHRRQRSQHRRHHAGVCHRDRAAVVPGRQRRPRRAPDRSRRRACATTRRWRAPTSSCPGWWPSCSPSSRR